MPKYVMGIDQSTQGIKILLFDEAGKVVFQASKSHKQFIDDNGRVEHTPKEIWRNIKGLVRDITQNNGVTACDIVAIGISNQRETALACAELEKCGAADVVKKRTGLPLSPYFSTAKLAWIMQNVLSAFELSKTKNLCVGTVDSRLVYKMARGKVFKTDYSNASPTQLFNIKSLTWDEEICELFGTTDINGMLEFEVPI